MHSEHYLRTTLSIALIAVVLASVFAVMPVAKAADFEQFGPNVDQILIKLYANEQLEFAAFEAGEIDVVDWPLTKYWIDRWNTNAEIEMADYGGGLDAFEFDLNLNETMRAAGPAGSVPGTSELSIAAAFPEYRHAVAHLVDRVYVVSTIMQGFATPLWNMVPAALGSYVNPAVIAMHPYNPTEAASILAAAGIVDSDSNGFLNWPAGMMDGADIELDFLVRDDHSPGRKDAGDRLIWELTTNLPGPKFIVHRWSAVGSVGVRKWWMEGKSVDIYTGGWSLSRDPDYLFSLYHSSMYWHPGRPPNAGHVHDPELDAYLEGVYHAQNFADAKTNTWEAQRVIAEKSLVIGIYSNSAPEAHRVNYTGGTNGAPVSPDDGENMYRGDTWLGFANMPGYGFNAGQSFFNAHPEGHELPASAANPMIVRYGFKVAELDSLNPVYGEWVWDWEIMGKAYDSLLAINALDLSEDLENMADRWQGTTWGALTSSTELRIKCWAEAESMTRDVNGRILEAGWNGWTQVGYAPWLSASDYPDHYIHSTTTVDKIGSFTFAEVPPGQVTSVKLRIKCWTGNQLNDGISIYLFNGITWSSPYTIIPTNSTAPGSYEEVDVTNFLDTNTKINAAQMRLEKTTSQKKEDVGVDHVYLDITQLNDGIRVTLYDGITWSSPYSILPTDSTAPGSYKEVDVTSFFSDLGKVNAAQMRLTKTSNGATEFVGVDHACLNVTFVPEPQVPPFLCVDVNERRWDPAWNGWERVGSSPWLDTTDYPASYIQARNTDDKIGNFGFADVLGLKGTELIFDIRNDIYFHDGVQMTADDIYFTFVELLQATTSRGLPPPWYYSNLLDVNSVIIENPFRVRVRMNSLSVFAFHWIGENIILPRHIWGPIMMGPDMTIGTLDDNTYDPETFAPDPGLIGSGPFKVYPHSIDKTDYYVPTAYVRMDGFTGYWGWRPSRQKIAFANYQPGNLMLGITKENYHRHPIIEHTTVRVKQGTTAVLTVTFDVNKPAMIQPGNKPGVVWAHVDVSTLTPGASYAVEIEGYDECTVEGTLWPKTGTAVTTFAMTVPINAIQGDINDDGVVDVTDATMMSAQFGLRAWVWNYIDLNEDNVINLSDASMIIRDWSI